MTNKELQDFLDDKVVAFNNHNFIQDDPISVPHQFKKSQDIEIAGLIAAVFSWGQRTTIISKAKRFLELMDNSPHDFVLSHSENDLRAFTKFVHRTFQPTDALYFIEFLSNHFKDHDSLEDLFLPEMPLEQGLNNFHNEFFSLPYAPDRTKKHVPSPYRKSTCKRINMFLRWMVRRDDCGVDFGLWNQLSPSDLLCPLDVHVGIIARELGILKRKQNDWKATVQLTEVLRTFDPFDPVKYDFALFGIGVSRKF